VCQVDACRVAGVNIYVTLHQGFSSAGLFSGRQDEDH
jgi:hypothetical protein